jgi:hypothetical protein
MKSHPAKNTFHNPFKMFKKITTRWLLPSLLISTNLLSLASAHDICDDEETPLTLEITRIYPSPDSGEEEWIEIQNTGDETLTLSSYTLEDSTEKAWTLPEDKLEPNEKTKIEGFDFALNNGGDTVTLKTIHGEILDFWEYGDTESGEIVDGNAPDEEPEESEELEETEEEIPLETPSTWPDFSEALPNPEGSDSTEEWIELFNPFDYELNLEGLFLDDQDGGSKPHALEGKLSPHDYLLLSVEDSQITLNNSVDSIRLLGASDEVLWEVTYDNPKEGLSLIAITENEQAWTQSPTPGKANEYLSTEEDEEKETDYENGDLSEDIELNEVFPNPEGSDAENEWIEITNGGDEAVNLGNWTLDDGPEGSDPYTIPDDTLIEPGETLIFYRSETDIALNNSNESVYIYDYSGETMDEISYEKSHEGQSYAKIKLEESQDLVASTSFSTNSSTKIWEWGTPSPGLLNPIWKQYLGTVKAFNGTSLTLFNGVETLDFSLQNTSQLDSLLYKEGNTLLVKASLAEGLLSLQNVELIEQAKERATNSSFPWETLSLVLFLLGWTTYELYKKRQEKLIFLKRNTS